MPSATAAGLAGLDDVAAELADAGVGYERSQMFGCPGLRRPGKGKFFVTLWGDDLVVNRADHERTAAVVVRIGTELPVENRFLDGSIARRTTL